MHGGKSKSKVRLELGGVRFLRERAGCPWKAGELWPWDRIGLLAGAVALDEKDRPIRSAWYSYASEALTTAQDGVAMRLKRRARLKAERARGFARLTWETKQTWAPFLMMAATLAAMGISLAVFVRPFVEAVVFAIPCVGTAGFLLAVYRARRAVCAAEFHADRLIVERIDGTEQTVAYETITSGRHGFLVYRIWHHDGTVALPLTTRQLNEYLRRAKRAGANIRLYERTIRQKAWSWFWWYWACMVPVCSLFGVFLVNGWAVFESKDLGEMREAIVPFVLIPVVLAVVAFVPIPKYLVPSLSPSKRWRRWLRGAGLAR